MLPSYSFNALYDNNNNRIYIKYTLKGKKKEARKIRTRENAVCQQNNTNDKDTTDFLIVKVNGIHVRKKT
jgi:hypothetical protein